MFDVHADSPGSPSPGRALGERLQKIEREIRRWEAEAVAVAVAVATIVEAERTGAYADDGHSTVSGWCRALTKWSTAETTARVRVARLTQREPSVVEALASGAVGVAQCRELGRAGSNPRCGKELGVVLAVLLGLAEGLASFEDFRLVVRRWEMLADTDGTHRDRTAAHAARSASLVESGDERILRANCDAATGVVLKEIFERFNDAEWQTDWDQARAEHDDNADPSRLARADGQRRFDALAAILRRAASTPAGGQAPSRW